MDDDDPGPRVSSGQEQLDQTGATLRQLRMGMGWTLAELSGRSGLSPGQLGRIERGHAKPSGKTLTALAGALGISATDFGAITRQATQDGAELAAILSRLAIPRNVWHEFLHLDPRPRQALVDAIQRQKLPNADRWQALPEIEAHVLAHGVEDSTDVIVAGIERFGLSPADFLRSAAQLEELPGDRIVMTDRMPMTPLSVGIDQMHIFRATFGVDPPNPMLLKWWADARRTAIKESTREHESRTICALDRLERYFRTGERAPGIVIPFETIRNHVTATIALLRENQRFKMGLLTQMPRLAFRIKGDALALVTETGFALGPNRTRVGTALRFTRPEVVHAFRASFDRLWHGIAEEYRDSEAIALWLEGWLDRIGTNEKGSDHGNPDP